ncbi:putative leader peptide [Streptomyces asiaticus]|uniref:putative leader peptide n=1 Tax=Streptomyces asiaticus TaxID=114695 RepID=UPI003D728543
MPDTPTIGRKERASSRRSHPRRDEESRMQRRQPVYADDAALAPFRGSRWSVRLHVDLRRVSSALCHA